MEFTREHQLTEASIPGILRPIKMPLSRLSTIHVENIMRDRANGRNLVWVEKTNFSLLCRRKDGRSKIGCRATVIQTASKGPNLHCIGAMTSSRLVNFDCRRGSVTSESGKAWMRDLINKCTEEGIEKPTIIIDNAPAHSNVETILGPNEDEKITRLASCSYLINPIELLWSSFKASVKMILRDQMPIIIQFNRRTNTNMIIGEYRMQKLEAAAKEVVFIIGVTITCRLFYSVFSNELGSSFYYFLINK